MASGSGTGGGRVTTRPIPWRMIIGGAASIGILTTIVGGIRASGEILEWTPIASESFVTAADKALEGKITLLAGSMELLQKGLLKQEHSSVQRSLAQAEGQLFDVDERLKDNPQNPDAKTRRLQLNRNIRNLETELRRLECETRRIDNPNAVC